MLVYGALIWPAEEDKRENLNEWWQDFRHCHDRKIVLETEREQSLLLINIISKILQRRKGVQTGVKTFR